VDKTIRKEKKIINKRRRIRIRGIKKQKRHGEETPHLQWANTRKKNT
jgi:hypothetical protein